MAAKPQGGSDDIITDINVTPLVDIILVLLIIFMLTANIITQPSIEIELPEAATGEGTEPTTLALTLDKEGRLFLNGQLSDEDQVREYIRQKIKDETKIQAIIAADQAISHGQVVRLIDIIRQLGIYKFALNIDPITDNRGNSDN